MNGSSSYRLFLAIAIPEAVRRELRRIQQELREVLGDIPATWTRADQFHLTLRFLGNVPLTAVGPLERAMRSAMAGFGALSLSCEQLGCFPDLRSPRVVWARVQDAEGRLDVLVQSVNNAVARFAGRPAELPFHGHVTLARLKRMTRVDPAPLAGLVKRAASRRFGAWPAMEIQLIRSELGDGGSTYRELAVFSLNA